MQVKDAAVVRPWRTNLFLAALAVVLLAAGGWLVTFRFATKASSKDASLAQLSMTTSAPRFNVLLVTIDTLRTDKIGLYGNKTVKTPNLDYLGQQGTWFNADITVQPNTNASHTSLFTGVFPFVHGVRFHMLDPLSPNVETLAQLLERRGYATAGFYSWVVSEKGFSGLRGFQTYENVTFHPIPAPARASLRGMTIPYRLLGKYLFLPGMIENQVLQGDYGTVQENTDAKANVTTDAALRWLDDNASRPFFLWVHYFDPHYPYTPPPPFDTMYDPNYRGHVDGSMTTVEYIYGHGTGTLTPADVNHLTALYEGEVSFADQQVGRLLDEFDRRGLNSSTIVVLTADHGESLGAAGRWFHGTRLNYTDIHVPLIIRFPPAIPAHRSVDVPVQSIDVMPTVLDLLKMPVPARVQGASLLPVIAAKNSDSDPIAITMLDNYRQISVVDAQWHLLWDRQKNSAQLFDHRLDPLELEDVAARQPAVVARLLKRLDQRLGDLKFPGK